MTEEHFDHFDPSLYDFLEAIKANNDREWFNDNKDLYESTVREPARAFIRAMRPMIASLSPYFLADDRKSGGSLMRIYRDTRFSKDERPYKTNVGIQFRHERGKDVHAPGLYVHLEPGEVFLGVGLWQPDKEPLQRIRQHLADHPERWLEATGGGDFKAHFKLGGEALKRPPRGFDKAHPLIEDIKRTSFIGVGTLTVAETLAPGLPELIYGRFEAAVPFIRLLCDAVDAPF